MREEQLSKQDEFELFAKVLQERYGVIDYEEAYQIAQNLVPLHNTTEELKAGRHDLLLYNYSLPEFAKSGYNDENGEFVIPSSMKKAQ